MRKRLATALVSVAFGLVSGQAQEGTHYTPGIFNIQDFAVPGPGVYFQNFTIGYSTDTFRDAGGNRVSSIDLGGRSTPIDIDLDTFVVYPSVYWMTGLEVLGGDYGVVIGAPFQNVDISASLPSLGVGVDDSKFGIGDIMLQPLLLGWHPEPFDLMFGYIAYAPTGDYSAGALNNLGLGYWTHELQASAVYRAGKDKLWTVAGMLTYDFHSEKDDIEIRPGQNLTFEWGVSRIFPSSGIELGVTGYGQWQTTDDKGSDVTWDRRDHDEVYGIGGQLSWTSKSQKLNLALRYLSEFDARDRFEGDLGVFTITYSF